MLAAKALVNAEPRETMPGIAVNYPNQLTRPNLDILRYDSESLQIALEYLR